MANNLNIALQSRATFDLEGFEHINFQIQETPIPGISAQGGDQPTPVGTEPHGGGTVQWDSLQLTYHVDDDLQNFIDLYNWFHQVHNSKLPGIQFTYDAARTGRLYLYSAHYNLIRTVYFTNCIPTDLGGLTFTEEGDTVFLTSTVTMKYSYYEFE